jgi:BlaI family penicillinase repressor
MVFSIDLNSFKKMTNKMLPKPTDSELEILQVLWENGPSSVRFVNEQLGERKDVGYTTTLKLLQIMHEKGLVVRNTDARSHIYEAAIERDVTQRNLLGTFVDNVFSGSAMNLVMQALGNHKASKDELDQIKALIEKMENEG